MTPSARVPGADGEVLAAVFSAVAAHPLDDGAAAREALAAAGRVLAERLHADAEKVRATAYSQDLTGMFALADRLRGQADTIDRCRDRLLAWCGAPSPEGADDGSGRDG